MSVKLGRVDLLGNRGYVVSADFPTVGGLKNGSTVEIAGVEVGRVDRIVLQDYQAHVVMVIQPGVKLQDDSIASIKTKGLIGERYVRISPGGSDKLIPPNGRIREVEPPVDIEELLSKYIFGKV
jgi:phospholipid/cholesterol/gamma-HCH transport system substrate-binding protein